MIIETYRLRWARKRLSSTPGLPMSSELITSNSLVFSVCSFIYGADLLFIRFIPFKIKYLKPSGDLPKTAHVEKKRGCGNNLYLSVLATIPTEKVMILVVAEIVGYRNW